jgi:hypothetical protein
LLPESLAAAIIIEQNEKALHEINECRVKERVRPSNCRTEDALEELRNQKMNSNLPILKKKNLANCVHVSKNDFLKNIVFASNCNAYHLSF